jgi:hypothetical protein
LDVAFEESMSFLTRPQYVHFAQQFKELAQSSDPTHSDTISLDKIEDFYEMRDKGGVLGPLNVRIFFDVDAGKRAIVAVGAIKKQNNGPTPQGDKIRMRRRCRQYRNGELGIL